MKVFAGHKRALSVVALATLLGTSMLPATAHTLEGSAARSRYAAGTQSTGVKGFFERHPKVKSATVGAGVGAAAGAVTGLLSGKGTLRGAAIGAGTGAGVGLVRSSNTLARHPVIKDTATGTLVGAGLGLAASKGHGKTKKVVTAT
ncbi:MAG TPA: YMGG-like glycine zipper-containing protein, partial [Candidatus Obscuribacterales bacterium]